MTSKKAFHQQEVRVKLQFGKKSECFLILSEVRVEIIRVEKQQGKLTERELFTGVKKPTSRDSQRAITAT